MNEVIYHSVKPAKRTKNANATHKYRSFYAKKIQKLKLRIFLNLPNWKQQWVWTKFCNQIIAALEDSSRKKFAFYVFLDLGECVFYLDLRTYKILIFKIEKIIEVISKEDVNVLVERL
jgi:hypothetical protein